MNTLILITGGCRSGKSAFAQRIAEGLEAPKIYLATAPVLDDEMALRIAKHQADRAAAQWRTVEEPLDIAGAIVPLLNNETVLVDCLTLWINNLMYDAEQRGTQITEEAMARRCQEVIHACRHRAGTVILVTNEVGMGIVPANPPTRLFRDLAGRCNQVMADASDMAICMVSGLPLYLKGNISILERNKS
jgi:adenosylcobinamide kinase/adenosylcobinamide-phosphate guanylyltransferase